MYIVIGGDVMLGRLVKEQIHLHGADYPLGEIASFMKRADITLINLECAITSNEKTWPGEPKPFYFGAPPEAIHSLLNAGVNLVSLANNHILDFNHTGLKDTLRYLNQNNIFHAGAGENITEAKTPAIFDCQGIKFGMVAFCDHQVDFSAAKNRPGMAFLDIENKQLAIKQIHESLIDMQKQGVVWPILSLHWGPNMVEGPSQLFQEFAHQAIDLGYKMLFGHSAHTFHGIEIYKDCPIIYAAGDLVDDYAVDSYFKNDHQLLFEIELEGMQVKHIFLYPVFIDYCRVKPADDAQFKWISEKITQRCAQLNTPVNITMIQIKKVGGQVSP